MVNLFPVLPSSTFSSSALVGSLTALMIPDILSAPDTASVSVHPLVVVGLTGLLVNALNFIPVGRLDGGRAASCVLGRPATAIVGSVVLIAQVRPACTWLALKTHGWLALAATRPF